ncbi:hypothetical protein ODD89_001694, partial [Campylobacter jejuni]|nr:hypothetical protein [Campylobacter jejuni]
NLSLGGASIIFSLYCTLREKNKDIVNKADLVILESNIIDMIHGIDLYGKIHLILRNIFLTYNELSKLNKKFLVLLLPLLEKHSDYNVVETINNAHRMCCNQYGFNCVDVQSVYLKNNVMDFYMTMMPDVRHQLQRIMYEFGKNIANENFSLFKFSLPSSIDLDFKICSPKNDFKIENKMKEFIVSDLFHNEYCYRITEIDKYLFPTFLIGYKILATHSWTHGKKGLKTWKQYENTLSSIMIQNNQGKFICGTSSHYNSFTCIYDNILIDNHTIISLSDVNNHVDYYDLVNLMLYKDEGKIQVAVDDIKETVIKQEYNFSHLFPDVVFIKEILEEYLNSTSNISIQISSLTQQLNHFKTFSTAKQRIQNQLPYRLGQAMIINSKNFLGYIFLPYILLSIVILYKQEQKNYKHKIKLNPESTLPPLETYPDYNEALKEKRCFTYKLGLALIEANKK